MRTMGNAGLHVSGTTHRPLPTPDLTYKPHGQATAHAPCERCGWRQPGFHVCVAPASAEAPTKPQSAESYAVLTDDQVEKRFAPEAPSPILGIPVELDPDLEPGTVVLKPRPRVRAKVTAAKPGPGVLIGLRHQHGHLDRRDGPDLDPVEVAEQVAQERRHLDGGDLPRQLASASPEPKAPKKTRRTPAKRTSTGPRGTSGGKGGSTGKLAGKDAEIIERYKAGGSCREIASHYDCTDMAIRFLLKRNGVELRTAGQTQRGVDRPGRRTITEEQSKEIAERYAAGASMRDIGRQLDLSENGVRYTLHRLGVEIRPKSRRARPTVEAAE